MDQLKRVMETIRKAYDTLRPTHKMLALSLATVLGMSLFLVHQYSRTPDMVTLIGADFSSEDQADTVQFLRANNIVHETAPDGSILVQAGDQRRVISEMGSQGIMPGDSSLMFRNLIDRHKWTMTSSDKSRAYQLTLQNELSLAISGWDSVRSATVILNLPDVRHIGRPATAPSASVNVVPAGDFSQKQADAVSAFVAGASRGLRIDNVRVTDSTGRQYKAAREDDFNATDTQELVAGVERMHQSKLYDFFAARIPGVVISVRAQVDATSRSTSRDAFLPEGGGSVSVLASQNRDSSETTGPTDGGNPGARANVGASIQTGGSSAAGSKESTSVAEFDSKIGSEQTQIVDRRGFATKLNAVVNVPRRYFEDIWRQNERLRAQADESVEAPAEDVIPTDDQLRVIRDDQVSEIEALVMNQLDTSANDGAQASSVVVSMMPLPVDVFGVAGETQSAGFMGIGGGGAGGDGVGDVIRTLGLGGLAVLALGLVVYTALKANKHEQLPTAEELVGIPPTIDTDDEIIGEAEGADPPMEGIEVTDEEMHKRRMQGQIGEVVRERPEDVARIINQWMQDDE